MNGTELESDGPQNSSGMSFPVNSPLDPPRDSLRKSSGTRTIRGPALVARTPEPGDGGEVGRQGGQGSDGRYHRAG